MQQRHEKEQRGNIGKGRKENAHDAFCLSFPNLANTVAEVGKKLLDGWRGVLKNGPPVPTKATPGRREAQARCRIQLRSAARLGSVFTSRLRYINPFGHVIPLCQKQTRAHCGLERNCTCSSRDILLRLYIYLYIEHMHILAG